uniref:Uncharacterized protein n=1 Tax=Globodera rostochiensis TaxID=31243 RepID=A0A914I2Q4_GLORO
MSFLEELASFLKCSAVDVGARLRNSDEDRAKVMGAFAGIKMTTTYRDKNGFYHSFFLDDITTSGADVIPAYGRLRAPFNSVVAAHYFTRHRLTLVHPHCPCAVERLRPQPHDNDGEKRNHHHHHHHHHYHPFERFYPLELIRIDAGGSRAADSLLPALPSNSLDMCNNSTWRSADSNDSDDDHDDDDVDDVDEDEDAGLWFGESSHCREFFPPSKHGKRRSSSSTSTGSIVNLASCAGPPADAICVSFWRIDLDVKGKWARDSVWLDPYEIDKLKSL